MHELSSHLTNLGFPKIDFIVSRWFLCCYFGVLPAETAVRVMDLFFASTHGGSALGRDGPTVLMRVGIALLKWIEPSLLEVTPNDSIKACMAIQNAGSDLMCAADLDILLYTAFEEVGELETIQNMRDRLDHATGEEEEDADVAARRASMAASAAVTDTPGTGKRKRRAVARVWDDDAAKVKAQEVTRAVAAEANEASKRPAGMPVSSPGVPTPKSAARNRRFSGLGGTALRLSDHFNSGSPAASPKLVNTSPFKRNRGGGTSAKKTFGRGKSKSIAMIEGEIDLDSSIIDRCLSTSSQEGVELTDLSKLSAATKMRVLLTDD